MARFQSIVLAAFVSLIALPALAQEFKGGDITIDKAWSRATPKGAAVGAGYLVIHNHGATPDKLIGGAAEFAGNVSVHEMSSDNGIMRMRELTAGLEIPAHGEVVLSPGGYHIMFTGLKQPLNKGEIIKASLIFEHAGTIGVEFAVGGVGAAGPAGAAKPDDSMKGMKM
ncbi:copper chaperone PCu(A)C [Methylocapsa sp. S129]|uniref:copper chaperone PCu(A)C n=1 Tax=Methylocapsa sp. S129 TaxID=1641869 RepID=UPI00131B9EA0|nr:copper chaperone PCu(A)C [Methylocapsa sp. S129]